MTSFDNKYKNLIEGFGGSLTTRIYAPRIKLSEKFINAFKEEYTRLCKPEQILDENDEEFRIELKELRDKLKEHKKMS